MQNAESFFHAWDESRNTLCFQVLFWGLRELKRVQLFEVEHPMVKVECAGEPLKSEEIQNYRTNPNFKQTVGYINVVRSCHHRPI